MSFALAFVLHNRRWFAGAGLAALLAVIVALHFHSDAQARKDRDAWHKSSDAWNASARGWEASFRASESRRRQEQGQAIAAIDASAKACAGRVAEARRSALAIRSLVTKEPAYDASHCPIRSLLDAHSLRDALQPAGAH